MSAPLSHYVRYDSPGWHSTVAQAVCGRFVDPHREFSASPTCPECQSWVTGEDDGLTADDVFGADAPGTPVHTTLGDALADYKPRAVKGTL